HRSADDNNDSTLIETRRPQLTRPILWASCLVSRCQHPIGIQDAIMKVNRPKPKKSAAGVVGVAWYREADWPRIKELFPDADQLHDSYAEWLKFAEDSVRRLSRSGVTVEPFVIDIDDFLGWCLVHDCPRDAKARTAYVVEKLGRKYPG